MRISLIIPANNEQQLLPRLLHTVAAAQARFVLGPEAIEVIVADNVSTDRTAAIAAEHGCQVVRVEKRSIAAARNGGARASAGEIVCCIDADMQIHPESFNAIHEAIESGKFVAGTTGGVPERWSAGIALSYLATVVPLYMLLCIDTGVVFCRREDFEEIGGYDESRLIAEDIKYLLALRAVGKKRGQRLTRLTGVESIFSTRKFDQHGDWHFLKMMPAGIASLFCRSLETEIANRYWYADDR